jgi:hypothetical protein
MKDPAPFSLKMRLSRSGCKRNAVCSSLAQTREVSLPILDSIMFSSNSVVPFNPEPYSAGPIYLPYISDSPNVARENEASAHSREAACPSSGVSRGARGGHIGGPAGPVETLVKVGRFSASSASRGSNLFVSITRPKSQGLRSIKVQGLNYVATCFFSLLECPAAFLQQPVGRTSSPDTSLPNQCTPRFKKSP